MAFPPQISQVARALHNDDPYLNSAQIVAELRKRFPDDKMPVERTVAHWLKGVTSSQIAFKPVRAIQKVYPQKDIESAIYSYLEAWPVDIWYSGFLRSIPRDPYLRQIIADIMSIDHEAAAHVHAFDHAMDVFKLTEASEAKERLLERFKAYTTRLKR